MQHYWMAVWTVLKARWDLVRREPEAGYSTETVLVTALLAPTVAAWVMRRAGGLKDVQVDLSKVTTAS